MLDIAIAGAGPGGLMAALRLHQQGLRPRIYEAVPELRPLGVGIDVKVYATKELDELGLLEEFRTISIDAQESLFFNRFGQEIYAELCGVHMGYRYEQRFVHRGYFQMFLHEKVLERLGPDVIVPGTRVLGYDQDGDGVTLELRHADGTTGRATHDVLIAADGINSVIRRQMHPGSADPTYSGITMWRGTTLMKPFKTGGTILHIGDPRVSSMIVYPLLDNVEGTGLTLVNWVVEATRDETVEDWNQRGSVDEILRHYDDTDIPFLDVQEMLRNAREVYLFPLIRHEPLDSWCDGRVTLLGDAAHAMYPRGGNGACQALVDGRVIAEKLATVGDPVAALQAYEDERREAVNRIVMSHRGEGYEVIRRMVAERTDGRRFDDIEKVLPLAEADEIFSKYHKLVGQERPGWEAGQATGFRSA
ncbi:flavin-dependent oxidoreductase [Winogradskya consettensis]|uniref:Flavin-dependent oxidoreductase n=1 Tax=Winogradskya consettensis TaxID=113560 RepID=A0A919SQ26_9ACTN|nr:FAD-dependent monooxygenase [Actinoplanes consettensis]GIM76291.1 flavin-dependent oxidoreductase [Actinoplanes consettensis]